MQFVPKSRGKCPVVQINIIDLITVQDELLPSTEMGHLIPPNGVGGGTPKDWAQLKGLTNRLPHDPH